MHKLHELKEKLMDELEEYTRKDELSAGDLEIVDKLTHTIKNLCKIIEDSDQHYSGTMYPAYTRARDGRGREYRNTTRYSMAERLRDLADDADPRTRHEIERMIDRM